MRKRFEREDFVEAFAGLLVALGLYIADAPLLAAVSAILGPALSASRYYVKKQLRESLDALQGHIDNRLDPVRALASVTDLRRNTNIVGIRDFIQVYLDIPEAELRSIKDDILSDSTELLRKLATQKRSDELPTGAYYQWLLPTLSNLAPGSHIWAVSMMLNVEWTDTPQEEQFLKLNIAASANNTKVERIFVIPRDKFADALENPGVKAHLANTGPHLLPYVAFVEDLRSADSKLLERLGAGFIAFDRRVLLVDMHTPEVARGYVSMNAADIGAHWRMFEQLRVLSAPLTNDRTPKLLAAPAKALGAGKETSPRD